ncbi:MAG: GspE/PulE family protein [bacterium]|nr:GspE/PulE family protein [bacterium]
MADKKESVKKEEIKKPNNNIPTEKELLGGGEVSIIKLIDALVASAYEARASDIHVDPEDKEVRVRFRVDGVLHDSFVFSKGLQSEVVTRLKVLSGLRTDEHQMAQDGRFKVLVKPGLYVDIRLSIAPTYYGENAVMRLLAQEAEQEFSLDTLAFSEHNQKIILNAIKKPYGMILATGPTGSGKTTTLYTIIRMLNTPAVSIITIEDPIEYSIDGIEQIQVNARTGITFAAGLRSILRQDPNIIMVGEIRDEETAGIAVNAALTGHLLLSTLHTNDAPTTLPRLIDMKIEPFLIASTVNIAMGQRLLRRVCNDCKVPKKIADSEIKSLSAVVNPEFFKAKTDFFVGKGCNLCEGGYKGRIGIHEVLEVTDAVREAIMKRADADEIHDIAVKEGMIPMIEDGLNKALDGLTTIEEIMRVIHE